MWKGNNVGAWRKRKARQVEAPRLGSSLTSAPFVLHHSLQFQVKRKHHQETYKIALSSFCMPVSSIANSQVVIRLPLKHAIVSCKPSIKFFSHQFPYAVVSFHLKSRCFGHGRACFLYYAYSDTHDHRYPRELVLVSFVCDGKHPFEKLEQHLSFKPAATPSRVYRVQLYDWIKTLLLCAHIFPVALPSACTFRSDRIFP